VCLDVSLPLLWARWTLNKQRASAFAEAGGTVTHNGLACVLDAMVLMRRLFAEDIALYPDLKEMVVCYHLCHAHLVASELVVYMFYLYRCELVLTRLTATLGCPW
jgi:hypothetical protein